MYSEIPLKQPHPQHQREHQVLPLQLRRTDVHTLLPSLSKRYSPRMEEQNHQSLQKRIRSLHKTYMSRSYHRGLGEEQSLDDGNPTPLRTLQHPLQGNEEESG